jgi:hypothetical protein
MRRCKEGFKTLTIYLEDITVVVLDGDRSM